MKLGADWQDFARLHGDCGCGVAGCKGPVKAEELTHLVIMTEELDDWEDVEVCDCCDAPVQRGELNEDGVCPDCEEEGRLEREHVQFESRSSLFL